MRVAPPGDRCTPNSAKRSVRRGMRRSLTSAITNPELCRRARTPRRRVPLWADELSEQQCRSDCPGGDEPGAAPVPQLRDPRAQGWRMRSLRPESIWGDPVVAIGIAGSRRVETIALQECDRRAGGAVGRITASDPRLVVDVDEGLCPLGGGTPFSVRLGRLWSACGTSLVAGCWRWPGRVVLGAMVWLRTAERGVWGGRVLRRCDAARLSCRGVRNVVIVKGGRVGV